MNPLKDVKVVEVASFYPAPFCCRLLAELGAEVTKIEPPGGEAARAFGDIFAAFNAGKRIVRLDLKSDEGKTAFFEIVKDSDVVVEGFRPGVAERLGIDYGSVRKVNPEIIYCSISAFGQKSKLSHMPAHDLNILGLAGILEVTEMRDPNVQLADFSAAMVAALLIVSALYERRLGGGGRYIDVSMLHSTLFAIPIHSTSMLNGVGLLPHFFRNPAYGVYRTRDGAITIGVIAEEHFWRRLCEALNLDIDFNLVEAFERYDEVREKIGGRLARMSTREALELLEKADVPAFEVLSLRDIERLENFAGCSFVEEVEFEGRRVKLIRPPFG